MSGHFFITQGNLATLACDAWLLPCDESGIVTEGWKSSEVRPLLDGFDGPGPSRAKVLRSASEGTPALIAADTGGRPTTETEFYAEGVIAFLRTALTQTERCLPDRERPLFAFPMIGTGAGGGAKRKGQILLAILRATYEWLEVVDQPLDVVLVVRGAGAHAAAQHARARLQEEEALPSPWAEVEAHAGVVTELAERARSGDLVLFLGAGVSVGAGLKTWQGLLDALGEVAELTAAEGELLRRLDPLEQAKVLSIRLEDRDTSLKQEVIRLSSSEHCALVHQLLASLPVTEAATTNYDSLFESAWREVDGDVAVIGEDSSVGANRWLLKLHGSVSGDPDDIVLSREDYLNFAKRGAALAGVVQAMLLTRHMLFVGFSLGDDNFHRILHEVSLTLGPSDSRLEEAPFGTVLAPQTLEFTEERWRNDLRFVNLDEGGHPLAASVRRLEILLDLLLAESTDRSAHLLDDTFDALFTPDEERLRRELMDVAALEPELAGADVWEPVKTFLEGRGGPPAFPEDSPEERVPDGARGSLHQLRRLVNETGSRLSAEIASALGLGEHGLEWRAPVPPSFAEYKDRAFLAAVDLEDHAELLRGFWPAGGPRWDGLAIHRDPAGAPTIILVEAKAHPGELRGSECQATRASRALIERSLTQAKSDIASADADWLGPGYQMANRIAHTWWLRHTVGVEAQLVYVLIAGDRSYRPSSAKELTEAFADELGALGVDAPPDWITAVTVEALR